MPHLQGAGKVDDRPPRRAPPAHFDAVPFWPAARQGLQNRQLFAKCEARV